MKQLSVLTLALGLVAAGCGDSPAGPDPNPGGGGNTTTETSYNVPLDPRNERPNGINNAEASASGTAAIKLRVTRDSSNAIVSAVADFDVSMQGFPAGSTITMAHIHLGDLNTPSGAINVDTTLSSGQAPLTNGAGSFQKTNINVPVNVAQGILNSSANYYFNVHSQMNPAGVLRAQMDGSGQPDEPGPDPGPPGPDPDCPYPPCAR